jgi:hypothetical protein
MVDELTVECPNREAGCQFTCQRQLLAAHLRDDCLFTEKRCPDPECLRKALRKDILGDNPLCPHRLVACEQAAYGCDWTGVLLASRETHIRDCPYVALRGFFCISDTQAGALRADNAGLRARLDSVEGKAVALRAENAGLRARLDSVEGMLAAMRRELQAVKGTLVPRDRPDVGPKSAPLSPPITVLFATPFLLLLNIFIYLRNSVPVA